MCDGQEMVPAFVLIAVAFLIQLPHGEAWMPRLCDSIGVVGNGVVGSAIIRGLLEHCGEMRVYDVVPEKCTHDLPHVMACDFVFASVPTNASKDGYDLTHLKDFFGKIRGHGGRVVLKSTVLPGTTDWLAKEYGIPQLVFSPEHLTARCSYLDFQCPSRNIVGYTRGVECSIDAAHDLVELYEKRFPGVPCLLMSAASAEMSKLAVNTLFATSVLMWNHIYDLCQAANCEFEAVQRGILTDGRVPHSHCEPIPPSGQRGAGGYCLQKELAAFAALQRKLGVESDMMTAADRYNRKLLGSACQCP